MTLAELIENIKSGNPDTRTRAWLAAGEVGAPAIKPLAELAGDNDPEVARAARYGLKKIVRAAGAPGGDSASVIKALLDVLAGDAPAAVKRDILWRLSEIGDDSAVEPVVAFLSSGELREDARCALQRIPAESAVIALKHALSSAEADYKPALAESLRRRGVPLANIPSARLTPCRETKVTPVGR